MNLLQGLAGSTDPAFESRRTETAHLNSVTEYCCLISLLLLLYCLCRVYLVVVLRSVSI